MNYKLTSSKEIIAKVFRDVKPDSGSWVLDAIEWIGEALEYIGVYSGLEKTFEDVEIENFRAALPCDLHLISMVEYNGCPLRYGSNPQIYALPNDPDAYLNPNAFTQVTAYFKSDAQGGNLTSFTQVDARGSDGERYVLNPGMIQTTFDKGTVRIHFMRIPTDKDNMPMVPDNVIVKEALQWYILRQMMFSGYKHPIFNFQYCDAKWEKTLGQAQNDLMFPSVDKAQSFKDMWVTMVPYGRSYDEFFNHD
ncbi:hypothetical protein PP178_03990 [Zeaxanthinibacter sp. PT1]|uniref:hypothetical protein n=1 Tax=Zeaxanthinibacter TaxID=561554 RepID=UPI002349F1A8|nr:hypothetical protein [Zeaxanthinibacter sp. PT1]MDC6350701.1 hypothetical protein [Zeaxanthinibacter sp. PT1]